MQENPVENENTVPAPVATSNERYNKPQEVKPKLNPSYFEQIRHATAWVMIISAILFALIGILAIWSVFGDSAGDVLGRAFGSLGIIAFAALIVNVAARTAENHQ